MSTPPYQPTSRAKEQLAAISTKSTSVPNKPEPPQPEPIDEIAAPTPVACALAPIRPTIDRAALADAFERAQRNDLIAVKDYPAKAVLEYLTTTKSRFPKADVLRSAIRRYLKHEYPELWAEVAGGVAGRKSRISLDQED